MTKSKRTTKKSTNLTVGMETGVHPAGSDPSIDALLSDLGFDMETCPISDDEIVEAAVPGEMELEAAVNAAETTEAIAAHYDSAPEEIIEGSEPKAADAETDAERIKANQEAVKAAEKAEKERIKTEAKVKKEVEKAAGAEARAAAKAAKEVERAEKKAAREAAKADKPAPVPRKHYTSKVERVTDKLGAELGDYTVLTLGDAALKGDELKAKQDETLEIMKGAGIKVQNRMTLLLEFCAGKSKKLNEVIERAFKILAKDGHIQVGDKGNFHLDLLAKPYSASAARAMGNNTLNAMRSFKVIAKNEEGVYVANPESLIGMKVRGMLGL